MNTIRLTKHIVLLFVSTSYSVLNENEPIIISKQKRFFQIYRILLSYFWRITFIHHNTAPDCINWWRHFKVDDVTSLSVSSLHYNILRSFCLVLVLWRLLSYRAFYLWRHHFSIKKKVLLENESLLSMGGAFTMWKVELFGTASEWGKHCLQIVCREICVRDKGTSC